MSISAGPGYPLVFKCSQERKGTSGPHICTPTGKTRPAPSPGKGHPRKAAVALQYRCSCGFVGWSAHRDLALQAIRLGQVDSWDVLPAYSQLHTGHVCKKCGERLVRAGTVYAPEYRCTGPNGCKRVYIPKTKA